MLAGYPHLLAAGRRLQWDDAAIDLRADAAGLADAPAQDSAQIRRLVAGFCVAEAAVAEHLAPFVDATADADARACFALQAHDEERHARFFARAAREVLDVDPQADARAIAGPELCALFDRELPAVAARVADNADALADAVGLYHLVLEGIVFAVGQDALLATLDERGALPGLREGVARVQADERWHIGLGVLSLQRLDRPVDVTEPAGRALAAWGPDVATPSRIATALAAHERRLRFVQPTWP